MFIDPPLVKHMSAVFWTSRISFFAVATHGKLPNAATKQAALWFWCHLPPWCWWVQWMTQMALRGWQILPREDTAVCQNLVPLVNIKIAGKWMFIPLKMVLIGIDPYPYMWWPIFGKWLLLIADDAKRNNMDIERRGFHRVSPITIAALLQQRSFHTAIPAYTGCKANTKVPFLAG